MIALRFAGYFQCRLPTDPDPTDEPRGVSGFMWAVAGEPDLDRIVRFHDPVAPRVDDPKVGVFVNRVVVDGAEAPQHPLVNARVELSDDACFEGRNGIVARSGSEPIVPFTLRIATAETVIVRDSGVRASPFAALQPKGLLRSSPAVIASATHRWNFGAVLADRAKKLAQDLAAMGPAEQSSTAAAALRSRLANMQFTAVFAAGLHDARVLYSFPMKGEANVTDESHRLDPPLDTAADWAVEFWMGAWDIDAMTGFVDGWLMIPHQQKPSAAPQRSFADVLGTVQPFEFADLDDE
jgi:hypothetical protein